MLQRVFVDSNVLASRTLRDWLFLLRNETEGMYQLHASFDVVVEAYRVWRRLNPRASGREGQALFERITANLDEMVGDFDGSIDFNGSDPGDVHVHAAAVASGAHLLLTNNGRDFGDPDLLPFEIYTPDEFFCLIDDGGSQCVQRVAVEQAKYWNGRRSTGQAVKTLDAALLDAGCRQFAARVTSHLMAATNAARPRPTDRLPRTRR